MSTPPLPPPGDAPPPPAGDAAPAAPAMQPHPQFATPAAKPRNTKKIITIAVAVLALGGIGFAGYKYGPGLWAKYIGGGDINTPDGTIKYVLNGLADNKPEVLWEALPAKHQKTIHEAIKKSGANVDAEIQTKTIDVLKKATGILKNKKTLILETVQAMSGGQGEGLPPEIIENWDNVVSVLEIVVNSKAMTPEWSKDPDIGAVLKEDGGKLMSSPAFEGLINWALKEDAIPTAPKDLAEFRKWVKGVEVELVESTETTATVKISSPDFEMPGDKDTIEMVKVEGRWLPKEMVEGLDQMDEMISMLQQTMPMGQVGASQMTDQQKAQLLGFLNSVDKALDTVNNAENSNDLLMAMGQIMVTLTAQAAGLGQAFGGLGGGISGINPSTGFPVTPGTQPGTGDGINPSTGLPGLAPSGPPGYRMTWTVGLGNRNRIDKIYPGKTEEIVKKVFGEPTQTVGQTWIYRDLKIRNIGQGGTFTTAEFQMQNGQVARVTIKP